MNIVCSETHLPFNNVFSPARGCQCRYFQEVTGLDLLLHTVYMVFLISLYQTPASSVIQVQG